MGTKPAMESCRHRRLTSKTRAKAASSSSQRLKHVFMKDSTQHDRKVVIEMRREGDKDAMTIPADDR